MLWWYEHACMSLPLILSPSSFLSTIFWVTVKQVLYIYSAPNYINWWIAQLTVYNKSSLIFFILTVATSKCTCIRERACSLVVTRASVAPEVLGSTPHGSEYSGILRRCAFSGRRCSRRQWGAYGDFVNLEDLPAQSSKMLIGIEFAYVYS